MKTTSKSSLFLLELILAILFFSLCSAVCVRLFAQARVESSRSAAENRAILCARSAAAAYKAAGGDAAEFCRISGAAGDMVLYYDAHWQKAAALETAAYVLKLRPQTAEIGLHRAKIQVQDSDGEALYALDVAVYTPVD